jgi:hypothetical protein
MNEEVTVKKAVTESGKFLQCHSSRIPSDIRTSVNFEWHNFAIFYLGGDRAAASNIMRRFVPGYSVSV